MPKHKYVNTIQFLKERERRGRRPHKMPPIKAARMIQKAWRAFSDMLDEQEPVYVDNKWITNKEWRNFGYEQIKSTYNQNYTQSTEYQRKKRQRIDEESKLSPPKRYKYKKGLIEWL